MDPVILLIIALLVLVLIEPNKHYKDKSDLSEDWRREHHEK